MDRDGKRVPLSPSERHTRREIADASLWGRRLLRSAMFLQLGFWWPRVLLRSAGDRGHHSQKRAKVTLKIPQSCSLVDADFHESSVRIFPQPP